MSKKSDTRTYGWTPQIKDQRDYKFHTTKAVIKTLPALVDLRPHCPPVYDQLDLGACVSHGIAAVDQFDQIKQGLKVEFEPSRLAIYYDARKIEGTTNSDAGANIRDGIKVLNQTGAGPETLWPYDITKFAHVPPTSYYAQAKLHKSVTYKSVANNVNQLRAALAAGFPVVFGFTVYSSFESQQVADTGIMPMPKRGEQVLGGHCVVLVGYDDSKQMWIVRNSWSAQWGISGYFMMPYAATTKYGSDFWTVTSMT